MNDRSLIRTDTLFRTLLACIAMLLAFEVLRLVAVHGFGHGRLFGFARFVMMNGEMNLPAWYSSVQLALASGIALLIFIDQRRDGAKDAGFWLGLAALMMFLSLDENTGLHERLVVPLRETFGLGGIWYHSWVIVGLIFAGAVAMAYVPFLTRLETKTAGLMLLAGGVFVSGAIGVEMISASFHHAGGWKTLPYEALTAVEETFEMTGIALFVFAIADYAARHCRGLSGLFAPGSDRDSALLFGMDEVCAGLLNPVLGTQRESTEAAAPPPH